MKWRHLPLLVAVVTANAGAQEGDLTYDEYQDRIGSGQQRLDYSESLVGHDKIHNLVPENSKEQGTEEENTTTEQSTDSSPKVDQEKGNRETDQATDDQSEAADTAATERDTRSSNQSDPAGAAAEERTGNSREDPGPNDNQRSSATHYVSPSLRDQGGAARRNQASVSRPEGPAVTFGISIGEKIPVELTSSASSVQPGLISVEVTEAIQGRERTLPAGTRFFARSSSVIGSDRLFLRVSKGVTPDGEEFQVRGAVFDDNREPGLAGRVVSDGRSMQRATSAGVNTLSKEVLDAAPLQGPGGEAADETLGQLLDEKQRKDSAKEGRPAYVVVAKPQPAIVQVERTF